jgi:hypothetical protein
MTAPTDKMRERARVEEKVMALVEHIRRQNWKNGGVHTVDPNDAIDLVMNVLMDWNLGQIIWLCPGRFDGNHPEIRTITTNCSGPATPQKEPQP